MVEFRPCHRRIENLKAALRERGELAEHMANEMELLCARAMRQIETKGVVISVEEVQDLFRRKRTWEQS